MSPKFAFYTVWGLQLLANTFILGMIILNFVLPFYGHKEGLILALIFARIFWKTQKDGTGYKDLIKDYKSYKEDQNLWFTAEWEINKRYSLKNKREIPERKVRKRLKEKKIKIWPQHS